MAPETSATEVAVKTNDLVLGSLTKTMDLVSFSVQLNGKLLQDALEVGITSIATARKFLETVQRSYLDTADVLIEFGKVNLQGQLKIAESVRASLARGGPSLR